MYGVFLFPLFPGTIGLSLAHQVSKIIGIEVVEKAVEDARWNAAFNGEFKLAMAESFKLTAEKIGSRREQRDFNKLPPHSPSRAVLHVIPNIW